MKKTPSARLLLCLFAACMLTLSMTTSVLAATVVNETFPYNVIRYNPCTGENLQFSGQVHQTITETYDRAGGGHVTWHFNTQGLKAVGLTSGNSYLAMEAAHNNDFNFDFTKGTATVSTSNANVNIFGKGSVPDLVLRIRFHVTVNANGDITSFMDSGFNVECRG